MVLSFCRTQTDASLRSAYCCSRASSVSEHDSSCALSCFHTASPVTVTCGCELLIVSSFIGCWFEFPNACSFVHQVSHRSFQPCSMNVCWGTHSSCKLFHCLLHVGSLSCHMKKSARHSSIQSCQHFWELSPSLFRACS